MQQRVFTVTCAALFAVLSVAEGINWSDQFIKTLMRRRDPATAAKLDQYNSWKNQASMIDRQGGYAEYLKQQKIAEAERKLEAEKRKLLCTPGCHDAANIDMPGFCNEIKRNNECENPAFKYDQCSFTCKGCSKCPPGYTPPTRKPKTTTAPPTTTTEPTVERSIVDGDNTTELVCTEVEQPCSNRIRWGCGRFYRNCNSKRTKSKCQKYCDLCEKETVCVTVTKEVEEGEETEGEKVEETEEQEEETEEEGKEEEGTEEEGTKEETEVAEEEVVEQKDEEGTEVADEQEDEEETEVIDEQEDEQETENEVAEEDVAEQEDEEEVDADAGNSTGEEEEEDDDDTVAVADSPAREKKVDCDPDCIDEITTCADLIEGKSDFCTDVWNISNKKCKASCKVCLSPCPIET